MAAPADRQPASSPAPTPTSSTRRGVASGRGSDSTLPARPECRASDDQRVDRGAQVGVDDRVRPELGAPRAATADRDGELLRAGAQHSVGQSHG